MRSNRQHAVLWLVSLIAAVGTPLLHAAAIPSGPDMQPQPQPVASTGSSRLPSLMQPAEPEATETSIPPAASRTNREQETSRVEHLRRAEQHLMAANMPKLATQLAREAEIEQKLVQIRELQAEVAQLRSTTAGGPTVVLQLRIVELQVDRMRKAGFDLPNHIAPTQPEAIEAFLSALKQAALVKVLAEPVLVTLSGRPASLHSGGELPVVVRQNLGIESLEYRQLGTRVDCLPTVLEDGRIRLELRASVAETESPDPLAADEQDTPTLRTRSVDTAVEMQSGQTVVLASSTQPRCEDTQTRFLVLVTADVDEPRLAPHASEASSLHKQPQIPVDGSTGDPLRR